ncbi:MAG: hypothetical protein ABIR37_02775 [Candidatus Saccharimonadales bacterium]
MDLQTAFYVVGLIFMGLMLVLFMILIVAVLVIRAKVNAIHRHIEEKLGTALGLIENGAKLVNKVKEATNSKKH